MGVVAENNGVDMPESRNRFDNINNLGGRMAEKHRSMSSMSRVKVPNIE